MKNLLCALLGSAITSSTFTLPVQGQILYCSEVQQQYDVTFLLSLSTTNVAKIRQAASRGEIRINKCHQDKTGVVVEIVLTNAIADLIN